MNQACLLLQKDKMTDQEQSFMIGKAAGAASCRRHSSCWWSVHHHQQQQQVQTLCSMKHETPLAKTKMPEQK
jgi:hypothetical protein